MAKNKHNQVHTGNQPGKADYPIESLLPMGKENAIPAKELVYLAGYTSVRELQVYIAEWQHKASTDRKQIEKWWTRWPDANIGIATGHISGGLVVIDLDIDKDKGINRYESSKEWERENGELPETCQGITGRGGYHLLCRDSAKSRTRAGLYGGIDIRGEGGYFVAPPSLHENGRRYTWEQEPGEYGIAFKKNLISNREKGYFDKGCCRGVIDVLHFH